MPKRDIKGESVEGLEGLNVLETGKDYPAKIVRVLKTTAGEIFQNKDGEFVGKVREDESPEDAAMRTMYLISFSGAGFVGEMPFNVPEIVTERSNLGKLIARYGLSYKPADWVGAEVKAKMTKEGEYLRASLVLA